MIKRKRTKTRERIDKAFKCLNNRKVKEALKHFEASIMEGDGYKLERDVAAWWMYNLAKYRREWKKRRYGNAHLYDYDEVNTGAAWSDVEIAVVLTAPNTRRINNYLVKFLGRNLEAIRFQRRYAHGRPLISWKSESGERYVRYTQNKTVKEKLGLC